MNVIAVAAYMATLTYNTTDIGIIFAGISMARALATFLGGTSKLTAETVAVSSRI